MVNTKNNDSKDSDLYIENINDLDIGENNYFSDSDINNYDNNNMSGGSLNSRPRARASSLKKVPNKKSNTLKRASSVSKAFANLPLNRTGTQTLGSPGTGLRNPNLDKRTPSILKKTNFRSKSASTGREISSSGAPSPSSLAKHNNTVEKQIPIVKAPVLEPLEVEVSTQAEPTPIKKSIINTATNTSNLINTSNTATNTSNLINTSNAETNTSNLIQTSNASTSTINLPASEPIKENQPDVIEEEEEKLVEAPVETPEEAPVETPEASKPVIKKNRRYYDEKKDVHKFEKKYMQDSSIGDVSNDNLYPGELIFDKHLTKLTNFLADEFDFLKIPDLEKSLSNFITISTETISKYDNIDFIKNNRYLTDITNAISNEPTHKVKIFSYKLYLFNIDKNIKTFIDAYNSASDTTDTHLNDQYDAFIKNVLGIFENDTYTSLTHVTNGKNSIKNFYENFKVENVNTKPYIQMYIPKLIDDSTSVLEPTTPVNTEILGGGGNPVIQKNVDIVDLNTDNISNNVASIKKTFNNNHWLSVTNNKKRTYGFNSDDGFADDVISENVNFTNKKVQDYFDKCNDLQIFYINKHIEIYDIFKEIINAIKNNLLINDIILKLLDPSLFPEKDDNIIRLRNIMTDISELNDGQNAMMNNVSKLRGNTKLNNPNVSSPLSRSSTRSSTRSSIDTNPSENSRTNISTNNSNSSNFPPRNRFPTYNNNEVNYLYDSPPISPPNSPRTSISTNIGNSPPRNRFPTANNNAVNYLYDSPTNSPRSSISTNNSNSSNSNSPPRNRFPTANNNAVNFGSQSDSPRTSINSSGGGSRVMPPSINKFILELNIFNDDKQLLNNKLMSSFDVSENNYNEVGNFYQYSENENDIFEECDFPNFINYLSSGKICRIIFGTKIKYFNDYYFVNNANDGNNDDYQGTISIGYMDDDTINFNIISINYKNKSMTIQNNGESNKIEDTSAIKPDICKIDIPNLKRHYITFSNVKDYFSSISKYQIIYGKLEKDKNDDDAIMMTYNGNSKDTSANANANGANSGIFVNILTHYEDSVDDEYTPENIIEKKKNIEKFVERWKPKKGKEDKDMLFMFVDFFIDNIQSYRTLQLIKRIQLINDESLYHIFKPEGKENLDEIIAKYKNSIPRKGKDQKPTKYEEKTNGDKTNRWKNFKSENKFNNNNLYFNTDALFPELESETITNSDKAQETIYKCYDLQILYLIKHLEVIELFKLFFYFTDMLFKKVSILLFVLALYKKKAYDSDKYTVRRIKNILTSTNEMVTQQQKVLGDLATPEVLTGGSGNVNVIDSSLSDPSLSNTSNTSTTPFITKKYFLTDDHKTIRDEKIKELREEAKEINDLSRQPNYAADHKEDLEEKLAKVNLDAILFELSEAKSKISKNQEQMQLIGSLSKLNSNTADNITDKFVKTSKYYDKQIFNTKTLNKVSINPNKKNIDSSRKALEKAKHIFQTGECLGGVCNLDDRLNQLIAIDETYKKYFIDADLQEVMDAALAINNLSNSGTKLNRIRYLRFNIEILNTMQQNYSEDIDIGYLIKKAKNKYDNDEESTDKRNEYTEIFYKYLQLIIKLDSILKSKYLNEIVPVENNGDLIIAKNKAEKSVAEIDRLLKKINKQNSKYNNTNNLLRDHLKTSIIAINNLTIPNNDKIAKYKQIMQISELLKVNLNNISDIEKQSNYLDEEYDKKLKVFDPTIPQQVTNFEKYKEELKEKQNTLIVKLNSILINFQNIENI